MKKFLFVLLIIASFLFISVGSYADVNKLNKEADIKSKPWVLVDFYADWCGPCKSLSPILAKISNNTKFVKKIVFYKVNVDENTDLNSKFNVRTIPCLILFQNGTEKARLLGSRPKKELINWLNNNINEAK